MPLSLATFVDKWKISSLSELQSAQSHFNELCDLLGQPNPTDADPTGEFFCFNKALTKNYGGKGFADVWKRGYFAWEYKGKHKDLKAAYKQINDYREDLLNPPLLVVCDTNIFQVHTNFQNTAKRVYEFNLDDLGKNRVTAKCPLPPLDVLRALFGDFNVLRPDRTDAFVTQEAARLFATLAERLEIEQKLSATPQQIADFLIRILFCIFADAIGLLPEHLFRKLLDLDRFYPRRFLLKLPQLFAAMSAPDGIFGIYNIRYFNGGLFRSEDADGLATIQLDKQDMAVLHKVAHDYNWAHIAPAIFGTLFERSLNKERRSLIGAHYTREDDILLLIEPVVMRPLRQRWDETKSTVLATLNSSGQGGLLHSNPEAEHLLTAFFDHLAAVRILDPACGSGNFLYVALRRLLNIWLEARDFAAEHKIQLAQQYALTHLPSPRQLLGIEVDDYAHRLASIVVWIGFLQWKHEHAVNEDQEPVLDPLETIEHNDAILRYNAEGKPYEPEWPPVDFIVGNPPFLGGTLMKRELGDKYCDELRQLYDGRVQGAADLVAYWFDRANAQVKLNPAVRVGLLATQGIRGGANQKSLRRILDQATSFGQSRIRNGFSTARRYTYRWSPLPGLWAMKRTHSTA